MKHSRFWACDTFMAWVTVAIASAWFGLLALVPGQTMVQAIYGESLKVMPQYAWGAAFVISSLLCASSAMRGSSRWLRIIASVYCCSSLFVLCAGVVMKMHSLMPLSGEVATLVLSIFLLVRSIADDQ